MSRSWRPTPDRSQEGAPEENRRVPEVQQVADRTYRPDELRSADRLGHKQALRLISRGVHELGDLLPALREAAQYVRRDDLRVRRIGPSDPHPDPLEVGRPELALQRLQPVVPGQAASEPRLDGAEWEVDLVVDREHAVEVDAERAARRPDGAAGLVHVRLRDEDPHARPAGAGAPVRVQPCVLLLRAREPPPAGELVRHLEADVVAGARVAVAGVTEPDDQPVDLPAAAMAEEAQDSSPPDSSGAPSAGASPSPSAGASPSSPSGASIGSPSSPTSSASSSISGSSISVGAVMVATIVSSGSSRNSTPSGAVTSVRCIVPATSRWETSTVMFSGMLVGSASMLSSRVTCSSTPPSFTPGASSTPVMSSATVVWIFSSRRTSRRSMCMTCSRTGWWCWSLTITGRALPSTATSKTAEPAISTRRSSRASTENAVHSRLVPP